MATAIDTQEVTDDPKVTYQFTLVLSGLRDVTDELAEAIYGAGCDDALIGSGGGEVYIDFDRESPSFVGAVLSAISQVESCGCRVREVRPPGALEINVLNSFLESRDQIPKDKIREFEDVVKAFQPAV